MKEKKTETIDLQGPIDKATLLHITESSLGDLWELYGRMSFLDGINPTTMDLFSDIASTLGIVRRLLTNGKAASPEA